ncbi:hypothetical protein AB9P05_00640 [Roseivirga sp. BDSF3-8]|uniref:hypothetical protein n=1 Tax=Roseivirga sp. BDSF3-8 TaxID=3241598 RepID=UPI003531A0B7
MATSKIFTVSKFDLSGLVNDKACHKEASERMMDPAPHWIGHELIKRLRLDYLTIDETGKVLESQKEEDLFKLTMASITLKLGMQIALFSYSDMLLEIPTQAAGITMPGQDTALLRKLVEYISQDMEVIWNNASIILPQYAYVYGKNLKPESF